MSPELITLMETVLRALAPVASEMIAAALAHRDPLDALAKERVSEIIPAPLLLELAIAAERAHRAQAS